MRVVHTIASLAPQVGGPSRSVPELCAGLRQVGVEAEIVTPVPPSEESGAVPVSWTRMKYLNARKFSALLHAAMARRPDLLHDHGIWLPNNHIAAARARAAGIPYLVSPRGMLEPWALEQKAWKKGIAWRAYQRRDLEGARVLHATSPMECAGIRKAGLRNPVAVIPNGTRIPEEVPENRRRVDGAPRKALFLSRFHPIKGATNLIEAWARVRPAGWRLVLAGPDEGNCRAETERAARRHGLEGICTFSGPVSEREKWDVFGGADLFVLPSFSENFGIAVAEALACRVPVIATTGTPWEELALHRCGWWVDPAPGPLAEALREATSLGDGDRALMGERGRRLVEERYSWDRIAQAMREVYEWILGGGPKPHCVTKGEGAVGGSRSSVFLESRPWMVMFGIQGKEIRKRKQLPGSPRRGGD